MFNLLIHGFYWGRKRNVERLIQSATSAGQCIPFCMRTCRAIDDSGVDPTAYRACNRLARTGSPYGNCARQFGKSVAGARHEHSMPLEGHQHLTSDAQSTEPFAAAKLR